MKTLKVFPVILSGLALVLALPADAAIKLKWDYADQLTNIKTAGYGVAVDPYGDFYTVGSHLYSETDPDRYRACVQKYSGYRQYKDWTLTVNGTGASMFEDSFKAVAADPSGLGAVVGGSFWSATGNDREAMLAYCYSWGATGWVVFPGVDSPGAASVEGVAVSGTSYIYCAGVSRGATASNTKIWIAKYDYSGAFQNNYYGTSKSNVDGALAITVDASGSVYAAGYITDTNSGLPGYQGRDIWVGKFSANLGEIWTAKINGPASSTDFAAAIALGPAGGIYLSGAITPVSGTSFQEHLDMWVARIDDTGAGGVLAWSFTLDGGEKDNDSALGVAVDSSGNVWATGSLDTAGSHWADFWLGKFSPSGLALDSWLHDFSGNGNDIGRGITVSGFGPVVVGVENDLITGDAFYIAQFREWTPSPSVLPGFVKAYPNPFRPGDAGSHGGTEMVVRSIPPGATVRFYTLSGSLVREVRDDDANGQVSWDAKNASGKDVGSGVYIFAASAPGSGTIKGKVVIIR